MIHRGASLQTEVFILSWHLSWVLDGASTHTISISSNSVQLKTEKSRAKWYGVLLYPRTGISTPLEKGSKWILWGSWDWSARPRNWGGMDLVNGSNDHSEFCSFTHLASNLQLLLPAFAYTYHFVHDLALIPTHTCQYKHTYMYMSACHTFFIRFERVVQSDETRVDLTCCLPFVSLCL